MPNQSVDSCIGQRLLVEEGSSIVRGNHLMRIDVDEVEVVV